ncbi:MAG: chorismate synthase [Clostridia bacterium]|nr:chorismate synthase [Clostridia bacterium]
MSNTIGDKIKCTVFGQSHSEAIGVVIEGVPAGLTLDMDFINKFMARRAPGKGKHTTSRKEADLPKIVSGIVDGVTCGAPICAVIENGDTRSGDYENLKKVPRPGHADFTAYTKFDTFNDIRGGGQFSGRLTAPLCFAGAVCMQLLSERGISVAAHISRIADVKDTPIDPIDPQKELFSVENKDFPVIDDNAGTKMLSVIEEARLDGDSVGGIIECAVCGLDAGYGDPMFDGVENAIARAVFGVPGIKGIEFGAGFDVANMRGSENNDPFTVKNGKIVTETNNCGGILGGITNAMPIILRCAVKPTPSIAKEQRSVDLKENENTLVTVKGRHDPCIVPRAVPAIEAVTAIAIANLIF